MPCERAEKPKAVHCGRKDDVTAMRAVCQYLKSEYEEDLLFVVSETRTRKIPKKKIHITF